MSTHQDSINLTGDILIVDDESANLQLLSELLSREGYQVRPANSPYLAIDSALAQPPKLILLDVRMPEMDGFEVCRRLKREERTRGIPILFISALQDVQDRIRGFEVGGVDFITKPFQEPEVLARVRTHMNLRDMQLHLEEMVYERTAELSQSESRFRAFFEQAAVGIAHVALDGRFLLLNQKFCDIVGYAQDEMMSKSFQDISHPDDLGADLDLLGRLLDGQEDTYSIEKRYCRKDSSLVWVNLTVKIVRNEDSTPAWFVSVIEDISDRKQADKALQQSHDYLNHLTSTVPDAIFAIKMPERTVQWCSDSYGVLGYEPEECVGETTEKFYSSSEEANKVGVLLNRVAESGEDLVRTEALLRRKNGEVFPAEISVAVQKQNGEVVGTTALARDISERKLAEKALQQSYDLLKHLTTSIPDAVFSVKLPERVVEWADDSYNVMGLGEDPTDVEGRPTVPFFASIEDYDAFGALQREAIRNGERFMRTEVLMRRKDGTTFPAEVTGTFVWQNDEVKRITAMVRDITERRRAEQLVLDYQKRLKSLANQLTIAEESERRRIAADLHDQVGQSLSLARMQIASVRKRATNHRQIVALDEISDTLRQMVKKTRSLIYDLSPPQLNEIGLFAAISEWLEEHIENRYEIEVECIVNDSEDQMDETLRSILFRNIRELVTNVIKHSKAAKVEIKVIQDKDHVKISIKDDGIGFDANAISQSLNSEGGFGLFSIRERMSDMGGSLEILSKPGQGTEVVLCVPITLDDDEKVQGLRFNVHGSKVRK